MKSERLFNEIGLIDDKIIQETEEVTFKRKSVRRNWTPWAAAAIVVICLIALKNPFYKQQNSMNTLFSIKAYAMEQQADGSIELREVDLLNHSGLGGFYYDGNTENLYVNIGLGLTVEGENIKSVELIADNGIFATQHIKRENGKIVTDGVPTLYSAGTTLEKPVIAVYGYDFENIGKSITFDKDVVTEDLLLFLKQPLSYEKYNDYGISKNTSMTVRAVITFSDGEKQERSITFLPGGSAGIIDLSPEQKAEIEKELTTREIEYDLEKLSEALINEANKYGFTDVTISSIGYSDVFPDDVWQAYFRATPGEDYDKDLFTVTYIKDMIISISAYFVYSIDNDEYKVTIIEDQEKNFKETAENTTETVSPNEMSAEKMEEIQQQLKLLTAFREEAEKYGFVQASLVDRELYDETSNIWLVTFSSLIENGEDYEPDEIMTMPKGMFPDGTAILLNQTVYANISVDDDGEYTVIILEKPSGNNIAIPSDSYDENAGIITWYADLTHDGKNEKIVVELSPPDFENTMCYKISVYDKGDNLIWSDEEISRIHAGNRGYYLYNSSGKYYMLYWNPWISGGGASYDYEIFSFGSDGNKISYEKDGLDYNILSYANQNDGKDFFDSPPDEYKALIKKVNSYLSQSFILIDTADTGSLLYSTPDNRIGRLYPVTWDYDFDGDGLPDEVLYTQGFITTDGTLIDEYSDNVEIMDAYPKLTVNLGNGKSLTKSFINDYPDIQDRLGKYEIADIDGDGLPEIVVMNTTMGSSPNNRIYVLKYNKTKNYFTELYYSTGYNFTINILENYEFTVECDDTSYKSLPNRFYGMPENLFDERGVLTAGLLNGVETGVDGVYGFDIVSTEAGLGVEIRQYIWAASHAGQIGDAISVFVWKDGEFTLHSQRFEPYTR